MAELVRPWRGVSADERRATRRALLLEACLDAVGADGVAAVTVDRVCADAGLTKRYFYESFPDLDALLLAAADAMFGAMSDQMTLAVARTPDGPERGHALLMLVIDALTGDPRRARLYVESPGHPVLRRRREQAITTVTDFVATAVTPDPAAPVPDRRRLLATRLLVAGTTDLVTGWLAGDIDADRTAIVEAIERLARTALSSPTDRAPNP